MNNNIISVILLLLIAAVPAYAQSDNESKVKNKRILLKIGSSSFRVEFPQKLVPVYRGIQR